MIKTAVLLKISLISLLGLINEPTSVMGSDKIKIIIPNVKSDKGNLLIAIFNQATGFPEDASIAFQTAKLKAQKGKQFFVLDQLAHGRYAIAIFHDENGDGKMNKNMLGIPKEGYGVSNNVKNLMSAPAFKDAVFSHTKETELSIQLNY
jgi:uncharacterized protein (DUF2141 family)